MIIISPTNELGVSNDFYRGGACILHGAYIIQIWRVFRLLFVLCVYDTANPLVHRFLVDMEGGS